MNISKSSIEKLIRLEKGETIAASSMNKSLAEDMIQNEVITVITHGRNKSYRAVSGTFLNHYVAERYGIQELKQAFEAVSKGNVSRAEQVVLSGDSKLRNQRTFKGFLINSYEPINATLFGRNFNILPLEGSYTFIYDYEQLSIMPDTLIIGIENSENFRQISRQRYLFEQLYPNRRILFASRYPQNGDLVRWLQSIPNEYVHFGDLDLAGVHIFLSEFYRYLGSRSSFLISSDYDERITRGSLKRYDDQLPRFKNMAITDLRVQPVINSIHCHHRGYDQEGFIF